MLPSRKYYLDSIFDDFMDDVDNINDMKCDIYEEGDFYYIEALLPGYSKENVSLECENGYVTIMAVKSSEDKNNFDNKKYIRKESFYGKMIRKFYIGDVDEDKIKAEFKNGVLEIVVPKEVKKVDKKIIEIK